MPAQARVDRIKTIYSAAKGLNFAWRFSDFLKQPNFNGVSRYVPQVHRITFRFCKQSESSAGVRNFVESRLCKLGEVNPSVVVYSQPIRFSNPVIRAEYGNGRVIQMCAKNLTMNDVEKDVSLLLSRSGLPVVKLESRQNSITPSVQGQWTPMTWVPTRTNVAELPNAELGRVKSVKQTATEYILEHGIH